MEQKAIHAEVKEGVLVLEMRMPQVRNAISAEMKQALLEQAQRFSEDDSLKCMLLTGSEGVFCAGETCAPCRTTAAPWACAGAWRRRTPASACCPNARSRS
ncbi:enoyl-CoA hydratase-related protein [Ottowia sp. VDI28]